MYGENDEKNDVRMMIVVNNVVLFVRVFLFLEKKNIFPLSVSAVAVSNF
jgi:hypothetical protein